MEVIVNNHTPLTVKDTEGNVLFKWSPIDKVELKPMSEQDKQYLIRLLNKFNVTPVALLKDEQVLSNRHLRESIQGVFD